MSASIHSSEIRQFKARQSLNKSFWSSTPAPSLKTSALLPIFAWSLCVLSSPTWAGGFEEPPYLTETENHSDWITPPHIAEVQEVQKNQESQNSLEAQSEPAEFTPDFPKSIEPVLHGVITSAELANVALDQIINLGKKFWSVVEANQPVVSLASDRAHAIPAGVQGWEQMQNWQSPISKMFRVTYRNFCGQPDVEFTYRLLYTPGGSVSGRGQYLSNIAVIPADLTVNKGLNFNVQVTVGSITNSGSLESPVAAAEIHVCWQLKNWAKQTQSCHSFYIRGDGYFQNINGEVEALEHPSSEQHKLAAENLHSHNPFPPSGSLGDIEE
ncbi:MAG: hypothetical protein ACO3A2_06315 [Bdellovibrionia bacterium]